MAAAVAAVLGCGGGDQSLGADAATSADTLPDAGPCDFLQGATPADGTTGVDPDSLPSSGETTLQFHGNFVIDLLSSITVTDGHEPDPDFHVTTSVDDHTKVTIDLTDGALPNTTYVMTVGTCTVTFSTRPCCSCWSWSAWRCVVATARQPAYPDLAARAFAAPR